MNKELLENAGGGAEKMKIAVLTVELFKRKGSRFWQVKIVMPGEPGTKDRVLKRISTRSINPLTAKEFAQLAYRHFSKLLREGKLPEPTVRKKKE